MATVPNKEEILSLRRKWMTKARAATAHKTIEVVEFILGDHNYGFVLEQIREICPVGGLCYIPGGPHFALGVINLRGEIIPILDLQAFIGLNSQAAAAQAWKSGDAKAVIFETDLFTVGFLADEVKGAEKIPDSMLHHGVETLCGVNAEYVQAVTAERMIILDAQRLLNDTRLIPQADTAV